MYFYDSPDGSMINVGSQWKMRRGYQYKIPVDYTAYLVVNTLKDDQNVQFRFSLTGKGNEQSKSVEVTETDPISFELSNPNNSEEISSNFWTFIIAGSGVIGFLALVIGCFYCCKCIEWLRVRRRKRVRILMMQKATEDQLAEMDLRPDTGG